MIVVLDTNVLVSGIFFHGPPASILEAWFDGRFEVYATPGILEEYVRVLEELSMLKRHRFEHHWEEILAEKCHLIASAGTTVILTRDPSDAKFVECAIQSNARYLVSGDIDLQSYKQSFKFRIVSPRKFLEILRK